MSLPVLTRLIPIVLVFGAASCASATGGTATVSLASGAVPDSLTSTSVPATVASAPGPTQDRAADTSRAEGALLLLGDLPGPGWAAKQQLSEPSLDEITVDCGPVTARLKEAKKLLDEAPLVRSPRFSPGQGVELQQTIAVLPAERNANRVVEIYRDPAVPECLGKIAANDLGEGASAEGIVVSGPPVVEPFVVITDADDTVGFQTTLPVRVQGQDRFITVIQLDIRAGRAISELLLTSIGKPTAEEMQSLAVPAIKRMAEAFGQP